MSKYFPTIEECGHHTIFSNISLKTYAGEHLQVSLVDLPADGVVDWHSHPNEQIGVLVSGKAMFYIGEEVKELQAGDMYWMPSDVQHKVVAHAGPCQAVDVFYPIRPEYR